MLNEDLEQRKKYCTKHDVRAFMNFILHKINKFVYSNCLILELAPGATNLILIKSYPH